MRSSAGIGFAIPADLVNRVVPALISRGRAPLPSIGIAPVRPDLVARAGLSGVVIADVVRGSPAFEVGLRGLDRRTGEVGDIIVAVNGKRIESLSGFVAELDKAGLDSMAELTVLRGDQERRLRVKVVDGVR